MRLFSHLSHVLLAMCAIALPTSVCWAEASASASSPDTQTAKPAVRKHHKHAKHHGAAAKAGQKPSADTKLDSKTDTKTDKPEGKVHVRKTADKNNDQRATHGRTAHRDADSTTHGARAAKSAPKTCVHDPVTVVRGSDNHTETFPLTQCNGRPVQGSLAKLSSLAQSVAAAQQRKVITKMARGTWQHQSSSTPACCPASNWSPATSVAKAFASPRDTVHSAPAATTKADERWTS